MGCGNLPAMESRSLLCLLAAVMLAGCSPQDTAKGSVLNRGNGPDIKSLDPAFVTGSW